MTPSKPNTLQEWQDMFNVIYGYTNRHKSDLQLWLHLTEEAGEVAKDMRKERFDDLNRDLPDIFAWLCTFANKTSIRLEDAIWDKFPGVCPYCLREEHCVCIAEGRDAYDKTRIEDYRQNISKKPATFLEWSEMFRRIYGNVNTILSHASIGFHLMEEIGEVARDLRKDDHKSYRIEIADVFAWMLAIPMRMSKVGLDEMTWSVYPGVCKICFKVPCICESKTTGPRLSK